MTRARIFCLSLLLSCGAADRTKHDDRAAAPIDPPAPAPTPAPVATTPDAPPPPPGEPAPSDPGIPEVRYVGRFDIRDPAGPRCGWPGCRIVARFDGTAVSARLDEAAGPDGPSEWDVAIDGAWRPKIALQPGAHDYVLAEGLSPGPHTVELYKRTESQTGVTAFLGFDLRGGKLLAPPPRASRRIEIVGDSDVSGYGYAGAIAGGDCGGQAWLARYQDFHSAWGARLADTLGAELVGTVFSGKGFVFNAWRPDHDTIDVLYPRANPEDPTSTFALGSLVPDVVIVAIGGNDYNLGLPTDDGPAPLDAFTAKARAFTAMLRASYPGAWVLLMVYASLSDDDPPGRMRRTNVTTAYQTVAGERHAAGDAKVGVVVPQPYTPDELDACSGHGGPAYHARIAAFLAGELRARLGWK